MIRITKERGNIMKINIREEKGVTLKTIIIIVAIILGIIFVVAKFGQRSRRIPKIKSNS